MSNALKSRPNIFHPAHPIAEDMLSSAPSAQVWRHNYSLNVFWKPGQCLHGFRLVLAAQGVNLWVPNNWLPLGKSHLIQSFTALRCWKKQASENGFQKEREESCKSVPIVKFWSTANTPLKRLLNKHNLCCCKLLVPANTVCLLERGKVMEMDC